ncbi:MAG: hypothetical protein ACLQBL_08690 [Polyangiaceae bacterium]|jgi:hypothetical protein
MKRIHKSPATHATEHGVDPAKAHPHLKPRASAAVIESATLPPATATPATAAPVASAPAAIEFIALPPASANIPAPPTGWVPRPGADYRGTQPKAGELTNIEGAISDLQRFTNFAQVLGSTVPPVDQIIHLFQAGSQWSAMRVATASWDVFAGAQEGLSWGAIRAVMAALRPSFDLAVQVNSGLATMYPSLASVLAAQQVIARKGASTRAANKADKAAGRVPSHGKVGKANQKRAAKAALEATTASAPTPPPTPAQAPTQAQAPTVATGTGSAQTNGVTATAANGTGGSATNGATTSGH